MEKLELKHIAPYLPYGLQIYSHFRIYTMEVESRFNCGILNVVYGKNQLPLLRPISDLTKEIEVNGEKFVPMEKLTKLVRRKLVIEKPLHYDIEILIETYSEDINLYDGFLVMQKLFEWHFDVFGLIEKGLAVKYM